MPSGGEQTAPKSVMTVLVLAFSLHSVCLLKLLFVRQVGMCACGCLSSRLLITSGMIWIPYDWLNKFCNFYVAALVIGIISR